jgi:MFS family permease
MPLKGEHRVLWLLALASIPFAFVNTLFTQTVSFAADDFGRTDSAIGVGAAITRWGVIIVPPIALFADRIGRRTMLVAAAWAAPLSAASGALAPNFEWLVVSQSLARPLALVINVLILVILTEEMSRETRARSVGLVAIASSVGAGVAVAALPLADTSDAGWRWLYLLSLIWLPVAFVLQRQLRETQRFTRVQTFTDSVPVARVSRSRLFTQIAAAFLISVFIASASVYFVNYLRDERNYNALMVSIFTIVTAMPAGFGLIIGGRVADQRGRRQVGAFSLAMGTLLVVVAFATAGPTMWISQLIGGFFLGISFPALSVYRGEMFPTAHRSAGAATVTACGLIGGSIGLIAAGQLLARGWSYGEVMATLALAPILVMVLVLTKFPETVHRELEDITPDVDVV